MRLNGRHGTWIAAVALLAAFAWDASRRPAEQWSVRAAAGVVRMYQRTASRWMPTAGIRCRFTPTCSRYSVAVLERHGILRGTALTVVRLARCGPWTPAGTTDPPP